MKKGYMYILVFLLLITVLINYSAKAEDILSSYPEFFDNLDEDLSNINDGLTIRTTKFYYDDSVIDKDNSIKFPFIVYLGEVSYGVGQENAPWVINPTQDSTMVVIYNEDGSIKTKYKLSDLLEVPKDKIGLDNFMYLPIELSPGETVRYRSLSDITDYGIYYGTAYSSDNELFGSFTGGQAEGFTRDYGWDDSYLSTVRIISDVNGNKYRLISTGYSHISASNGSLTRLLPSGVLLRKGHYYEENENIVIKPEHLFNTLEFKKVDADTNETLYNWEFELKDINGNLIKKLNQYDSSISIFYEQGTYDNVFTLIKQVYCYNDKGEKVILIDGFTQDDNSYDVGDYEIFKLKETIAPQGYTVLDEETISLYGYAESGAALGNVFGFSLGNTSAEYDDTTGNRVLSVKNSKYETINISGKKTWEDYDNKYLVRPNSITLDLYADGIWKNYKEVYAIDNWEYDFGELPKYQNDGITEIEYTIKELSINYYMPFYDGYNITNKIKDTRTIHVIKQWRDGYRGSYNIEYSNAEINKYLTRPDKVEFTLYGNGEEIQTISVTGNKFDYKWSGSFDPVPIWDADGNVIKYTAKEKYPGDGYFLWNLSGEFSTYDKQYTHEHEELYFHENWYQNNNNFEEHIVADGEFTPTNIANAIKVKKIWENDEEFNRPESIDVKIFKDEEELTVVTLSKENNWEYILFAPMIDVEDNYRLINYRVEEVNIPNGYRVSYKHERYELDFPRYGTSSGSIRTCGINYFEITNSLPKILKGKKIWKDFDNADGLRPESFDVLLINNRGDIVDRYTVSEENNWEYEFDITGLDDYILSESINSLHSLYENKLTEYLSSINSDNTILTNYLIKRAKDVVIKKVDEKGNPIPNTKFDIYETGQIVRDYDFHSAELVDAQFNTTKPFGGWVRPHRGSFYFSTQYFMSPSFGVDDYYVETPWGRHIVIYTHNLKLKNGQTAVEYIDENSTYPLDEDNISLKLIDYENTEWHMIVTRPNSYLYLYNQMLPIDNLVKYYMPNDDYSDWIVGYRKYSEDISKIVPDISTRYSIYIGIVNHILYGDTLESDIPKEWVDNVKAYLKKNTYDVYLKSSPFWYMDNQQPAEITIKLGEYTTDENGEIKLDDMYYVFHTYLREYVPENSYPFKKNVHNYLEDSKLFIRETKTADDKYILDDTTYTLNLETESEITIVNKEKIQYGWLKIKKTVAPQYEGLIDRLN